VAEENLPQSKYSPQAKEDNIHLLALRARICCLLVFLRAGIFSAATCLLLPCTTDETIAVVGLAMGAIDWILGREASPIWSLLTHLDQRSGPAESMFEWPCLGQCFTSRYKVDSLNPAFFETPEPNLPTP